MRPYRVSRHCAKGRTTRRNQGNHTLDGKDNVDFSSDVLAGTARTLDHAWKFLLCVEVRILSRTAHGRFISPSASERRKRSTVRNRFGQPMSAIEGLDQEESPAVDRSLARNE